MVRLRTFRDWVRQLPETVGVFVDGGWRISRIETIPVWKSGHLDRSPTPR